MGAPGELLRAVDEGDAEPVRALLAEDPSLASARDAAGVSVLLRAAYRWQWAGADAIAEGQRPLDVFEAAAFGEAERLRALLAADASLAHARSPDGFTALHLAAFLGTVEAARLLLAAGADPEAVGEGAQDVRPLHSAAAARNAEVVEVLLAAGADPDARQRGGFTPPHAAAASGGLRTADLLLAAGADVGALTEDGRTALDLAEEAGHAAMTSRLAEAVGHAP